MQTAYNFTDAVYLGNFALNSPNNASADSNGVIQVTAGNHLANVPRQQLKLRLEYKPNAQWLWGLNMTYSGPVFSRGNENNQDPAGVVAGYTVFNLDASWHVTQAWEIFGRINNLFNRQYANFGVLGSNYFTGPGNSYSTSPTASQFVGLGQPMGLWLGVKVSF